MSGGSPEHSRLSARVIALLSSRLPEECSVFDSKVDLWIEAAAFYGQADVSAVCGALHTSEPDSMLRLCVRQEEFRVILWHEFPQSRPATGLQWEDAWNIMGMRLQTGCSGAVNDLGGRYLQFVRFESADTTMRFKNFKLHRGLTLVARNDEGGEERMTWLRSVAERKGSFKIFGVDD